jgi:hypothetical protein
VKKIVAGIEAAGRGHGGCSTPRSPSPRTHSLPCSDAVDQLGRQPGELLAYLATKTFDVIKRGVEGAHRDRQGSRHILAQPPSSGSLSSRTPSGAGEIGRTVAQILVTLVTHPGSVFDQSGGKSLLDLGRKLGDLFAEVASAGWI